MTSPDLTTTASTPPTRAADEQRIRAVVERAQEAQLDPAVLPALHTSDVVIVNLVGRRLFGRAAFVAAMTEAVASPLKDIRTVLEIDDIRFATPDAAVVSLTKTVHDERPAAQRTSAPPAQGVLTFVMTREADDWRIAVAQTTPLA
ncbi:SgcJ/EcaC family oxidoreductase [Actinomycetota bacterium Odt1-20B]